MTTKLEIIDLLDFTPGVVDMGADANGLSVLKAHFVNQVKANGFSVDAIYFSGDFPSVYFKRVEDFQEPTIRELLSIQRKIWNQGKVPFLYIESPTEIRVINCYEKPVRENDTERTIDDLWLIQKAKTDLADLKTVFDKVAIETGSFWKEEKYAQLVKDDRRVDKVLIESLKSTRKLLYADGKGLPLAIIHDLLLRSLFLLYLEDRGATDTTLYEGRNGYFELLLDKEATYKVFEKLERSFNGNLCPITTLEHEKVTTEHLLEIQKCFWLYLGSLFPDWRVFDFKVIPIQLISEIYEHFLSDEIGNEQKKASGTFYTPHPLAEFVLNETLPHASIENINFNLKVLDPTCGSGIFLVESLNRLLDRWAFAYQGKELDFETICQIVKDNIFGIEQEKEAIKVAAFSIYLAMLDRLNPKTLWQNKKFPYLIFDPEEKDASKQGQNLFRMSSLGYVEDETKQGQKKKYYKKVDMPFESIEYDLIVGNPPFGGKSVKPDVRAYLGKQGFGNETVEAFFHRATQLCPRGKIALISTSKVLFNTGDHHQNFRRFLFNDCYVDKIYNFSVLRRVPKSRGRNLFASTVRPIGVFFYSAQVPAQPSAKLMYCAPTTAIKNRIIDGIAIDPTDVKYLPREECRKPDTKIWKAAMWGTERDFGLINELSQNKSIDEYLDAHNFKGGAGFRLPSKREKPKENIKIKELPFLDARFINRYFTPSEMATSIDNILFKRLGNEQSYIKPHILIKEGQKDKRFCACFSDFDCIFTDSVYAIHSKNEGELKQLTAFLNSRIASYLMFLTAADWGIERERVKPNEILDLPNLCLPLPNEVKTQIITHVDEIIALRKKQAPPTAKANLIGPRHSSLFEQSSQEQENVETQINQLEQKIEALFWEALRLTETDKILIQDLLDYQLDAFQSGIKSNAYRPCELEDNQAYATYLCNTINDFLSYSPELTVWASVFKIDKRTPLNVVMLHLSQKKEAGFIKTIDDTAVNQILSDLEQYSYKEHSESIYYRKFLRYYNDDIVYIVKPNEKRFWSRSLGLNDADEIILEILSSEDERKSQ